MANEELLKVNGSYSRNTIEQTKEQRHWKSRQIDLVWKYLITRDMKLVNMLSKRNNTKYDNNGFCITVCSINKQEKEYYIKNKLSENL